MDVNVALWSDQASRPALTCKVGASLTINDDSATSFHHGKESLEQIVELILLHFLHLRTQHSLVSRQEKTQKVIPINYYMWMWMVETQSRTSYQALTSVLTNAKQRMVQPVAGS